MRGFPEIKIKKSIEGVFSLVIILAMITPLVKSLDSPNPFGSSSWLMAGLYGFLGQCLASMALTLGSNHYPRFFLHQGEEDHDEVENEEKFQPPEGNYADHPDLGGFIKNLVIAYCSRFFSHNEEKNQREGNPAELEEGYQHR